MAAPVALQNVNIATILNFTEISEIVYHEAQEKLSDSYKVCTTAGVGGAVQHPDKNSYKIWKFSDENW